MTRPLVMRHMLAVALLSWLILGAAVVVNAADGESDASSSSDELGFSMSFEVHPVSRLYVFGERVIRVNLTLSSGDTLCLNGTPIWPTRLPPASGASALPERVAARLYGHVPYVQALLAEGLGASEAAGRYIQVKRELTDVLVRTYRDGVDSGMSGVAAAEAALANARSRDKLDLIADASPYRDGVLVDWGGIKGGSEYHTLTRPERSPAQRESARATARAKAERMRKHLTNADYPCYWVATYGGTTLCCGEQSVADIDQWLDQAEETGLFAEGGPLPPHVTREIVEKRESGGGPPN